MSEAFLGIGSAKTLARKEEVKMNNLKQILAFRANDMRDRFPEPLNSFRDALEALQSDRAYLPEMSGQIICYLKSGESISIPDQFFLVTLPRFRSKEAAENWVLERDEEIKSGNRFSRLKGMLIADPKLAIAEQIEEAFSGTETMVVPISENDRLCREVDVWLNAAISALPAAQVKERPIEQCMPDAFPGLSLEQLDEIAIAWCKYRELQGALGGPVGKEYGAPSCDYD